MYSPYRWLACLLISLSTAVSVEAQPQFYSDQPADKRSTMFGLGWEAITDAEFADMAEGLLKKSNGTTNVRGATFLFEQCYSGGMFDDLDSALGSQVRWVGGSAARHDQVSWGQSNSANYPLDHWVRALLPPLVVQPGPMINIVNAARAIDSAGPNGSGAETPQSLYRNGGETINHRLGGISGHNAILWAGNANAQRHVNDIKSVYNAIKSAYQSTGDPWSIIVLGDDSDLGIDALPATKSNLQAAFDALSGFQGPNSDFLFFASDHGGSDTVVVPEPLTISNLDTLFKAFSLLPSELTGMLDSADATPGMVLAFDGLDRAGVSVFLDDILLGDPFLKRDRFGDSLLCVDAEILRRVGLDPELRIVNRTGQDIRLLEAVFRTSGVNNAILDVPGLVGDANFDCEVGAADYALWAAQFGQRGSLSADFDGNGSVGAGDYALWAANFGKTCPSPGGGAAVPEPASWCLALCGLVALGLVDRRRRTAP